MEEEEEEGREERRLLLCVSFVGQRRDRWRKVGERGSVGEVNCRESRGSVRGPARVILWGRYRGSCACVCMCRSEKGRRPVNHSRKKEEIQHWAKELV